MQSNQAKKVQEFYTSLFDWKIDANNLMDYGIVNTGAEGGINGGIGGANGGPNPVTFYVQVPDLQAFLDKAGRMGGKTVMPSMEIPDMVSLALFSDPEGNIVGLVKGRARDPTGSRQLKRHAPAA